MVEHRRAFTDRLVARTERTVARRPAGRHAPTGDDPLPITFLVWNVFAMGGTVRTVLRQAGALAARGHHVTIVSVLRHHYQAEPFFDLDPAVDLEVLVDRYAMARRHGPLTALRRWADARGTILAQLSLGRAPQASLLTDLALLRCLLRLRGVAVGTRAGLNLGIARFAHPTTLRVVQEHLEFARYDAIVQRAMRRHFARVDVVACLTEADARSYRKALKKTEALVVVIPNAIPDVLPDAADPAVHELVAVGRLEPAKGFDLLIAAFAQVAPRYPDWTLRIVGDGRRRQQLVDAITDHQLEDRIELRPGTPDIQEELATASIYVLSSRFEAFGMVLIEAMATGLAVVSFACRQGPREFLVPERNALLAPPKKIDLLADQLDRAMSDVALRERLGRAARADVRAFTVSKVTADWERVLDEARGRRPGPVPARR